MSSPAVARKTAAQKNGAASEKCREKLPKKFQNVTQSRLG
jgi:hypothetical protein